jgi:hypothetical protein
VKKKVVTTIDENVTSVAVALDPIGASALQMLEAYEGWNAADLFAQRVNPESKLRAAWLRVRDVGGSLVNFKGTVADRELSVLITISTEKKLPTSRVYSKDLSRPGDATIIQP